MDEEQAAAELYNSAHSGRLRVDIIVVILVAVEASFSELCRRAHTETLHTVCRQS